MRYQLIDCLCLSTNRKGEDGVEAEGHLQAPEREARPKLCRPTQDHRQGLQVPSCSWGAPGAAGRPRPSIGPALAPPLSPVAPSRPVSSKELPGGRGRRKPSENLGGGRMGDSKVKVAVRIRPMNRRGESPDRPGPPRRRRQVPGAPFPWPRPPCGVRPAPPLKPASGRGGRPARPETSSPAPAPPARDAPPSPTPSPGVPRAPRPIPLPFRRCSRPAALSPSRLPALPGGRPHPAPRARFLLPHPAPGPVPRAPPLAALQLSERRRPGGPRPPAWPGQPGTPRPHVGGPGVQTPHTRASQQEEEQGVGVTPEKVLERKTPSSWCFTLMSLLTWTVRKTCKYFD